MSKYPISEADRIARDRQRFLDSEIERAKRELEHKLRMENDPEYAARVKRTTENINTLVKALEAGYQYPGQPLKVESLDATLKVVDYNDFHTKYRRKAPALIGMTRKSQPSLMGGCTFCGQSMAMCTCLDGLDGDLVEPARDAEIIVKPYQAPVIQEKVLTRQELAESRIQKATKPIEAGSTCYLCGVGGRSTSLVQSKSTGFFVCAGCALRFLGE